MTSDGSETGDAGTNPQPGAEQVGTDEGGDQAEPLSLDKVAEILREKADIDLDALVKERTDAAAAEAAKTAGQTAQSKYDPRISALEKEVQQARAEAAEAGRKARLADIASMPKEKQEAAKEILKNEETVRSLGQMRSALDEAAKTIAADKMVLDLRKRGIEAQAEDFLSCGTPADMEAKAAGLRADAAERKLKEAEEAAKKGGKPADDKQPPAASQRAAPKKTATGGAPGSRPWEEQKGKGLGAMSAALRAQREAE